jgi:hypothetical protein
MHAYCVQWWAAVHLVRARVVRVDAVAADALGIVEALGHDLLRDVAADVLRNDTGQRSSTCPTSSTGIANCALCLRQG